MTEKKITLAHGETLVVEVTPRPYKGHVGEVMRFKLSYLNGELTITELDLEAPLFQADDRVRSEELIIQHLDNLHGLRGLLAGLSTTGLSISLVDETGIYPVDPDTLFEKGTKH